MKWSQSKRGELPLDQTLLQIVRQIRNLDRAKVRIGAIEGHRLFHVLNRVSGEEAHQSARLCAGTMPSNEPPTIVAADFFNEDWQPSCRFPSGWA